MPVEFTSEQDKYHLHVGPKISYSSLKPASGIWFVPEGLLAKHGLSEQKIEVFEWQSTFAFFRVNQESRFPFDPFAAAFYIATRYEEHLPHVRDKFDRFDYRESLAFKGGFLHQAVVNRWAAEIQKLVCDYYPEISFPQKKFRCIATFDIDNAYAYKGKGPLRALGGMGQALFRFDFVEFSDRVRAITSGKKDPYDTYDYILAQKREHKVETKFFFLLGDYGIFDKSVPYWNLDLQALIKRMGDYSEIGIHPSYASNDNSSAVKIEIARLADIVKSDVLSSRQHYLILKLPETYRRLIDLGVRNDYTMGFAGSVGFRAGLCTPFPYYDLDLEAITQLTIHPFAYMDGTLHDYMSLNIEEAKNTVTAMVEEVKLNDGQFISIWHNETLSDQGKWFGWREVFEHMLQQACQ